MFCILHSTSEHFFLGKKKPLVIEAVHDNVGEAEEATLRSSRPLLSPGLPESHHNSLAAIASHTSFHLLCVWVTVKTTQSDLNVAAGTQTQYI